MSTALSEPDFFNWLRGNQSDNRLSQTQVDAMLPLLAKTPPHELQQAIAAVTGWYAGDGASMQLSARGAELIKQYEAFVSKPYRDMVGVWTIGYGNTYYPDGRKVTAHDKPLTEPQAAKLKQDILNKDFVPGVNRIYQDQIKKGQINQNQFDALVSLAYNIGIGALAKSNSITANIHAGNFDAAAKGFLNYNKGTVKGVFGVIDGLTIRREKEQKLFLA